MISPQKLALSHRRGYDAAKNKIVKPKLFQYAACPFCNKVRSTLKYKGIDFETIEVHPLNNKEISFSPDYQSVPIYIDSQGKQVNDSTPIMRWIDKEFPEPKVFRTEPAEAERDEKWLVWSERLVQGLPTVIYRSFGDSLKSFDYITKVGKFGWIEKRMIKYSGAFVMTLVAKKIKKREQITDPDLFLAQQTKEWAEGLSGRAFMGGETPNASDLAVYGITQSVSGLRAGKIFKDNQVFDTWMDRMEREVNASKGVSHAKS